MKAVVLEIIKDKAVVLSGDGMMKEIGNRNYRIGQSIEMEEKTMFKSNRKYFKIGTGLVASLVIMLGGGSAYAYNTPVAQVSLDVNPSVIYSVNAFNKVIAVETNDDAEPIIHTIDWDGKELSVVIENTIAALKKYEYLDGTEWYENEVLIGVNAESDKKEQKLIKLIKNELQEIVSEEFGVEKDQVNLEESVVGVGFERVTEAKKLGVTPGKLNLVEKLDASLIEEGEAALTTTEKAILLKGTVKEIMAQLHRNKNIGNPDQTKPEMEIEEEDVVVTTTTGKGIEKNKDKIKAEGSQGNQGSGNAN